MKIQRISLWGGPCSGKSTLAAYIFAALKRKHYPVEFIDEMIKLKAWKKDVPRGYDSLVIIAEQLQKEQLLIDSGAIVISTGPPLMQCVYAYQQGAFYAWEIEQISKIHEYDYPAFNIFTRRGNIPFSSSGRFQTNVAEARVFDEAIERMAIDSGIELFYADSNNHDEVVDAIEAKLVRL